LFIDESGNGSIVELRTSINFGTASIGSPTSLVALPFSINAGTTVGSVSVLTTGLPNKDFLDAGASTCTAKTYASTTNCVVNVLFSGRSPGSRRGAVVLADGAGNALATVPLTGTATGPQQEFFPSTATVINAATSRPLMLAVDGNSNVFIPDADNGQIVKVTSAGVSSLLASGLSTPTAVAVDGAGNLHVTNNGTSVTRITPSGTQNSVTVAGAANLVGIALDAAGNQYVTDQNTGKVFKIALNAAQSTFASGFASANGVAVDAVGNVYVSDTTGGTISKITPAGVKTSLATGLNGPEGLAVDAAGDVYYALSGTSTIGEVPLGGSPTALQANGSGTPVGLAIDSSGNLFFSDTTLATVSRLNRQIPPALAFAQTVAGGTSSDSPKSASMQNIGNAPLTIASVVYPIDFPEDDSGSGTDCVAGPLASASLCTFSVDFKPISAGGSGTTVNLLENIKVTSNNYNQPGILSRIITSGTETKVASTLVLSASNLAPTIGTSYTITASASGSGSTPTGTVTFYSGGSFLATGTLDGSGATILTPNLTTGTHTITATYGGDTGYSTASAPLLTVMVEKAVTSVSLESSLNPAAAGTPVTFTATVPTTVTGIAPTGKVMFYAGGVGIGSGTLLGNVATFTSSSLTTHTITAMYLGDRTYASVKSTVGIAEQITP
jgi:sugar lactone lactonase YvrE